jgi:hypothetical protein
MWCPQGLRRETDKASVERRKALEAEISEKEAEMAKLTERWQKEKDKLAATKTAKERLESARRELEIAEVRGVWLVSVPLVVCLSVVCWLNMLPAQPRVGESKPVEVRDDSQPGEAN